MANPEPIAHEYAPPYDPYQKPWVATEAIPVPARPNPVQPPPLTQQAKEFITIYAEWAANGKPRRSPERVAEIRKICAGCEAFDPKVGNCNACGCGISKVRPLLSAASVLSLGIVEAITAPEMEGTSCPLKEPKWT